MLKGIPKIIPPELLKILCEMGHGDEIVIADGNFPAASMGKRVVYLCGHGGCEVLSAVLKLFPLDTYQKPLYLMAKTPGDPTPTPIWQEYEALLQSKKIGRNKILPIFWGETIPQSPDGDSSLCSKEPLVRALFRYSSLTVIIVFRDTFRLCSLMGSLEQRELSAKLIEGLLTISSEMKTSLLSDTVLSEYR